MDGEDYLTAARVALIAAERYGTDSEVSRARHALKVLGGCGVKGGRPQIYDDDEALASIERIASPGAISIVARSLPGKPRSVARRLQRRVKILRQ